MSAEVVLSSLADGVMLGGLDALVALEQGYTPFEGLELTGRVKATFLRGQLIHDRRRIVGPPAGRYVERPSAAAPGPTDAAESPGARDGRSAR
jgi:hypothetical protein